MKLGERRVRDLFLGIIIVMLALWAAGCDGAGEGPEADLPDGGVPTGRPSDAGVKYCEIPSPAGDVLMTDSRGSATTMTMRQYYQHAAETGGAGSWGVVTNLSEFSGLCSGGGTSSAVCQGVGQDPSTYCYYADCTWASDGTTQLCHLDGLAGKWSGDSRLVVASLCRPDGRFAGWLCKACVGSSKCSHL